ncbi:MAG: 3-deoxy-manno-octulosonate cytidylyltransferase [Mailhella sp.]|nr:3-deoxy-manno-octulosonate cytidylyltransferase [Mailhella sp.]
MAVRKHFAIIPSRYGSTRLPGKALADLGGKPLFWHVYIRAAACPSLDGVWVATDDGRIASRAEELGVPCVMTSPEHPSGTDRVMEAARKLSLPGDAVIANIQGDEPFITPDMVAALLAPFDDPGTEAATLGVLLDPAADVDLVASPSQVKIVCASNGNALYFSRAAVPFLREGGKPARVIGHIGMYAFRRDVLERMTSLPPGELEQCEKLEQLRLLENGISMRVVLTAERPHGIDTPEDLRAAREYLAAHPEFLQGM